MSTLKKHLSLDEQIELLISRGLAVEDKEAAKHFLFDTNYYRLTGYLHAFKKPGSNDYEDGLSFTQLRKMYEFDRKLNRILMFILQNIEETFKARLSYTITKHHPEDPLVYLDSSIYNDIGQFKKFESLFKREVKNNSKLPFVKHHFKNYGGQLPMWVAVELFTMGNLSAVYKNLLTLYRKELAKTYDTGPNQLESWMDNLTYTRNHLAHYMRVYNFNFGRSPKTCKKHSINHDPGNMIFDQILAMSYMYSDKREWNSYVIQAIWDVLDEYKEFISLECIGFPDDWQKILTLSFDELVCTTE